MDSDSLQKWKDEFENERKKQLNRVKALQKETINRQKAIEMRAEIESAKEEKRRKEALAERRAKHVEATMRYQKGIGHFRAKKEKINLEEILSSKNRSRLDSADSSKIIIFNNELANYYCVNRKSNSANLKKSLSFESLNSDFIRSDSNIQYSTPKNMRNNTFNIIEQYNPNQARNGYNLGSAETLTKIKKLSDEMNVTRDNIDPSNIKTLINNNQKNLYEINKNAMKKFEQLVKHEIKDENNEKNFYNGLHRDMDVNSDAGTIVTVDDMLSDRDSMDTDSLINARFDTLDDAHNTMPKPTTANKKDYENDDQPVNQPTQSQNTLNDNRNNININREASKFEYESQFMNYNDPFKYVNQTGVMFNRVNMSPKATPSAVHKNYYVADFNEINRLQKENEHNLSYFNSNSAVIMNNNNKPKANSRIKSILKRSSSLDTNINLVDSTSTHQIIGLNIAKFDNKHVKDSIELTNSRINSAINGDGRKEPSSDNARRKSVRFASQDGLDEPSFNDDSKPDLIVKFPVQNKQLILTNNQDSKNVKRPAPKTVNNNHPNLMYSRISSTNSIRRPVIKPRITSLNKPTQQKAANQTGDYHTVDQLNRTPTAISERTETSARTASARGTNEDVNTYTKPPVYPVMYEHEKSYSSIGQKRRELIGKRINSPKSPSSTQILLPNNGKLNSPSDPSINDPVTVNHRLRAKTAVVNNSNNNNNNSNQIVQYFRPESFIQKINLNTPENMNGNMSDKNIPKNNLETESNRQHDTRQTNGMNTVPVVTPAHMTPIDSFVTRRQLNMNNNLNSKNTNSDGVSTVNNIKNVETFAKQHSNGNVSSNIPSNIPIPYFTTNRFVNNNQQPPMSPLVHQTLNPSQTAQNINRNPNNFPPSIHLEIKYPLYSNYQPQVQPAQPQAQYINITKPVKPSLPASTHTHTAEVLPNTKNPVVDSMALFLKAEDMAAKNYTESQIIREVNDLNDKPETNHVASATSLSMEEKKLKNSIMRLNERLNLLTYNRSKYVRDDMRQPNFETINRLRRPFSTNNLIKTNR